MERPGRHRRPFRRAALQGLRRQDQGHGRRPARNRHLRRLPPPAREVIPKRGMGLRPVRPRKPLVCLQPSQPKVGVAARAKGSSYARQDDLPSGHQRHAGVRFLRNGTALPAPRFAPFPVAGTPCPSRLRSPEPILRLYRHHSMPFAKSHEYLLLERTDLDPPLEARDALTC